jgi:hypothetical protein
MDACHFVNNELHHLQIRVVSLVLAYFYDFSIQYYHLNFLKNSSIFQTLNPCNQPSFFFQNRLVIGKRFKLNPYQNNMVGHIQNSIINSYTLSLATPLGEN